MRRMIIWLTMAWLLILLIGAYVAPESQLIVAMLGVGMVAWVLLVSITLLTAMIRASRTLYRHWEVGSSAIATPDTAQQGRASTAGNQANVTHVVDQAPLASERTTLFPRAGALLASPFRLLFWIAALFFRVLPAVFTVALKILAFVFEEADRGKVIIKPYSGDLNRAWEFDGRVLQPYSGDLNRAWKYDGRILQPYYGDLNQAWALDGVVPAVVLAKVLGIIEDN